MRTLTITTLLLTSLALSSAMAAQVTGIASVRIMEPVRISMELGGTDSTARQAQANHSIEQLALNTSRDYHYAVSYKAQDNCAPIDASIDTPCATTTVNFN